MHHHVTSLELSRRLKELGVSQKSLFYWYQDYHTSEHREKDGSWTKKGVWGDKWVLRYAPEPRYTTADVKWNEIDLALLEETKISAFLSSELGEMLNENVRIRRSIQENTYLFLDFY